MDPYPTEFLIGAAESGEIKLVRRPAQMLSAAIVEQLEEGDLFFVDSTHTLGPSGEGSRIILDMLPRIRSGVFAHFHDIYFPYDYPGNLLQGALFFGHESVLLHGFLLNNDRIRIMASFSMLHHARADELKKYLPNNRPREND